MANSKEEETVGKLLDFSLIPTEEANISLTREQFNDAVDTVFYKRIKKEEEAIEKNNLRISTTAIAKMEFKQDLRQGKNPDSAMLECAKKHSKGDSFLFEDIFGVLFETVYPSEKKKTKKKLQK